jgi:hypothetical protein
MPECDTVVITRVGKFVRGPALSVVRISRRLLGRIVGRQGQRGCQIKDRQPGMVAGGGKPRGGPSAAADKALKEITKTGLLDRAIDGRPLRRAGEGFKLPDLGRRMGLEEPP